jgi:hypothetical protein
MVSFFLFHITFLFRSPDEIEEEVGVVADFF